MLTTAKLAHWIAKFALGTVVIVGLPLITFSSVEFIISEIEAENNYRTCLQAKTLDGMITNTSSRTCKR